MKLIKKVGKYSIFNEPLQGMYIIESNKGKVSLWFNSDELVDILELDSYSFIEYCKSYCIY